MRVSTDDVAVKEGLEQGWSIPSEWYVAPARLEQEEERIFERSWQYAGRADQLSEPGSYITTTVGAVPIVVVRDRSGELRAYINICPHRGHEIAQGTGRRQTLQCGYHAWTFNLDGTLRAAPRSEHEPDFRASEVCLMTAKVGQWGPLIFVNPDPDAIPLESALENLPGRAEEMDFILDDYTFHETHTYETDCNWKVILDNATECYHCEPVHRGFADRYSTVPKDFNKNLSVVGRSFSYSLPLRQGGDGSSHDFQLYYLWPNFMILLEKDRYYWTSRSDPISAGKTRVTQAFFFHPSIDEAARAAEMEMMVDAIQEDVVVNESVQRSLNSNRLPRARFFVNEEKLLGHLQKAYVDAMAVGR